MNLVRHTLAALASACLFTACGALSLLTGSSCLSLSGCLRESTA